MNRIFWKLKRFFGKIHRVIQFIPIVWKGEDWDYRYAIDLFKYQLERLADYIESHDRHTRSQDDVKRIRTVCKLMNKVYDEEYALEYFDDPNKEFLKCQEKQERAHRILWKLIEKDIRRWWD